MQRIIGIDLGTTYSCVAVFNERKGLFEVLPSKTGQQTTPSVISINNKGEVIVGDAAKRQLATKRDNTIVEIKRRMGEMDHGKPYTAMFAGREHTPEELSAYILRELKEAAERALGEKVTAAVITVPAYFEEPQRQATIRAGQLAGLEVKRILNEPTAAAIAYGHDQQGDDSDEDEDAPSRPMRLLIYDLGGGTFDVSVIEVERGNIRVKSTHGNHYLGGVDFDEAITNWTTAQIKQRYGVDIDAIAAGHGKDAERARLARGRIRLDAEGYKKELSAQDAVLLTFPSLPVTDPRTGDALDIELELTRADFEALITGQIRETLGSVDQALKDAKLAAKEIDEVILVGGSTRIPMVKRALTRHFGKEPRTDVHPDLCVALGAAHEAVKHIDMSEVAAPAARIAVEEQLSALPAVVDVTGHSLGISVVEGARAGMMSVLIPRQTAIPAMFSDVYSTHTDNQTTVRIEVYQGEHRQTASNTKLREFLLENLPERPAGQIGIEVTFALDSNGTLTVSARDTATGRQREVEIRDERLRSPSQSSLLPGAGGGGRPAAGGGGAMERGSDPALAATAAPPEGAARIAKVPDKYKKFVQQAMDLAPRLGPAHKQKLTAAVDAVLAAVHGGQPAAIDRAGDALVDVLFDVRP